MRTRSWTYPAHIPHRSLNRQHYIPRSSRRKPRKLPHRPANARNCRAGKPCSQGQSPPIPAQATSPMTGLSRRRPRVRVPSLPSRKVPAKRITCCLDRRSPPFAAVTFCCPAISRNRTLRAITCKDWKVSGRESRSAPASRGKPVILWPVAWAHVAPEACREAERQTRTHAAQARTLRNRRYRGMGAVGKRSLPGALESLLQLLHVPRHLVLRLPPDEERDE